MYVCVFVSILSSSLSSHLPGPSILISKYLYPNQDILPADIICLLSRRDKFSSAQQAESDPQGEQ